MGQYYKPVSLDKKAWVYSHDIKSTYERDDGTKFTVGQGLKLMEHSYIGNDMMVAVENLLKPNGAWHKTSLVWAGDYADNEPDSEDNVWDMHDDSVGVPQIPLADLDTKEDKELHYIVNHTKKLYIDKRTVEPDEGGYKIHPLSLLTCEGNGRGGGDYHGEYPSSVGIWARDIMSMEYEPPEGYKETDGQF